MRTADSSFTGSYILLVTPNDSVSIHMDQVMQLPVVRSRAEDARTRVIWIISRAKPQQSAQKYLRDWPRDNGDL